MLRENLEITDKSTDTVVSYLYWVSPTWDFTTIISRGVWKVLSGLNNNHMRNFNVEDEKPRKLMKET